VTDLAFRSAGELAALVRSREVGSRELLEHYIDRVERYDGKVNAVVARRFEAARGEADEADRRLGRAEPVGPLHGVPMTIKESFHLAGTPTTFGYADFRDNIATTNATAVGRLRAAGAVIFGKTNVPPGLMDGQSDNPVYGRTCNPWNLGRTPGGSSGGSAAALAAGLTGLELGSDIASSIRNPAHFCGVFGHKPTWGLCPPTGQMLKAVLQPTDIAVIGPLARSAADLELALSVIAGPEGAEAGAYRLALPAPRQASLKDFRVAVVLDDPQAEVDREVQDQLSALADFLGREGASVEIGARPDIDSRDLYFLYMMLLRAASAASEPDEAFTQALEAAGGAGFTTREIGKANAYGLVMPHRDWLRLNERRLRFAQRWDAFFERFDLMLCPVLSSAAPPHSDIPPQQRTLAVNGHEVPFENQLFWAGYSGLFHLPASVAPLGLTPQGLPVGVQIIGPKFADLTCLCFASLLEQRYRGFQAPPGFAQ
jgi:amidase